jgi:heme/copper-type cytochrome/quinol oxidase subunit 3
MFVWWRDVVREATFEGKHTEEVEIGLKAGMVFFIVSEIMFFAAFFWAFFSFKFSTNHLDRSYLATCSYYYV